MSRRSAVRFITQTLHDQVLVVAEPSSPQGIELQDTERA